LLALKIFSVELFLAKRLGLTLDGVLIPDRAVEYSFVLQNLECPPKGKILDVGCLSSVLPFILISLGYDTYGIDIRKCPLQYPNFKFFSRDIRYTEFPNEYFDRIIAVSTLEHVGLSGRYGSDEDPSGDIKAINEMTRILKPDGRILITVPYGKAYKRTPDYRIYDYSRLKELLGNLRIEKVEYYKYASDSDGFCWWRPASHSEVMQSVGYHAIIALKLRKHL
jgi:SAM-dependent methyltransferase